MSDLAKDITVVVPAHRAEETLPDCLAAIRRAGVPPDRILVIDDGSPDACADLARKAGVRLLQHETPRRPAGARNAGVEEVSSEIVVFVDADVVLNDGALDLLLAAFDTPGVSAAIGSYDAAPRGGTVGRYRNLLHHHVHQTAKREAETFWSGFGAVRRDRFLAAGGLDPAWENIEDVEFGLRLWALGDRIMLVPEAQATHLKDWTLQSMFRTDLWGRAVPWTRLLIAGRMSTGTLNGGLTHRLAAGGVVAACLGLLVGLVWLPGLMLVLFGVGLFLAVNFDLWRRLARIDGPLFALRAMPLHAVHYIAALLGYGYAHMRPEPE